MSEYLEPGRAESIHYACGQRSFRSHYREVDPIIERESLQTFHIGILKANVYGLLPYSGVSRSTIDCVHLRAAAQRIHYCMLTTSGAYYKYFHIISV